MPLKGLKELYRVCKPGGQVLLLEHVLSSKPLIARVMNFFNPVVVALKDAEKNGTRVTLDYRQDLHSMYRCTPSEYFVTKVEK